MSNDTMTLGARSLAGDPASLADEHLEHQVVAWSAHLSAATAHWLALVAEYDRRRLWEAWECASMVTWLSWHCGIDGVTAREHLRVARRLGELPLVRDELAAGRLSYSKVRVLTRVATPATEADLVEIARSTTASQLSRRGRGYATARRNIDPAGQHDRRSLQIKKDADGSYGGRFRLTGEDGAALSKILRSLADDHTAAALADALVGVVTGALAPGEQAALMVHIGVDDLKRQIADSGVAEADNDTPLTAEVARRIGCDARRLGCVDDADGNPLRLGRTKRVVSRALRRALLRRDRGCRFPGCTHSRWLHAHHMIHWLDEGRTEIENLVMLCSKHHSAVHEHGWEIVMTECGFDAVPPDATRVIVAPVGHADDVEGAAGAMPEPGWHGQPWDLAICVEVLLWTEERYQRAGPFAAAA